MQDAILMAGEFANTKLMVMYGSPAEAVGEEGGGHVQVNAVQIHVGKGLKGHLGVQGVMQIKCVVDKQVVEGRELEAAQQDK